MQSLNSLNLIKVMSLEIVALRYIICGKRKRNQGTKSGGYVVLAAPER